MYVVYILCGAALNKYDEKATPNIVYKENEELVGKTFIVKQPLLYVNGFSEKYEEELYVEDRVLIDLHKLNESSYKHIPKDSANKRLFRAKILDKNETLIVRRAFQIGNRLLLSSDHPTYLILTDSNKVSSVAEKTTFESMVNRMSEFNSESENIFELIGKFEVDNKNIFFKYCSYKPIVGMAYNFALELSIATSLFREQAGGISTDFKEKRLVYSYKNENCTYLNFGNANIFATFMTWFPSYSESRLVSYYYMP
ncbi:MAG: hypothetical protein HYV97_02855 [Bdellovibrio sp.]|nr:hypothetical protein [Bdellovibrio sp.]